jgi:hypothetical protein
MKPITGLVILSVSIEPPAPIVMMAIDPSTPILNPSTRWKFDSAWARHIASYASQTDVTRGRSCQRINGAMTHFHDANRSPLGPPRPEQRRQSPYGACQRKCGNAGSHRERVASERRYEPERPCSRPQRARGAHTSGQPLLACGTSLAAVEAAGGVRRALAPSHPARRRRVERHPHSSSLPNTPPSSGSQGAPACTRGRSGFRNSRHPPGLLPPRSLAR